MNLLHRGAGDGSVCYIVGISDPARSSVRVDRKNEGAATKVTETEFERSFESPKPYKLVQRIFEKQY